MLIVILVATIGIPVTFYIILSTDWAQERLRQSGEEALYALLGTEVSIGEVNFTPFNRIIIRDVAVVDDYGAQALKITDLEARYELIDLLVDQQFIIDYVAVDSLYAHLYRKSADAPLNIASIITRFQNKEKKEARATVELCLNSVEINHSAFRYDVLDAEPSPEKFDKNHIFVENIDFEVYVPHISTDTYQLELHHLSFYEQSGFKLENITFNADLSPQGAKISDFQLDLPNTSINLDPVEVPGDWQAKLSKLGRELPASLSLGLGSYVYLPDLAAFVPQLRNFKHVIDIDLDVSGTIDTLQVRNLELEADAGQLQIQAKGLAYGISKLQEANFEGFDIEVRGSGNYLSRLLSSIGAKLPPIAENVLSSCANPQFTAHYDGTIHSGSGQVKLMSDAGDVSVQGEFKRLGRGVDLEAEATLENCDLGAILGQSDLGVCTAQVYANGSFDRLLNGEAHVEIDRVQYKGYAYQDISAKIVAKDGTYETTLKSEDPNARLALYCQAADGQQKSADLVCRLYALNLDTLNLYKRFPGHSLSGNIQASVKGVSVGKFSADLRATNLHYIDYKGQGLSISKIDIDANNADGLGEINIASDFINGNMQGNYNLATIGRSTATLLGEVFPSFAEHTSKRGLKEEADTAALNNNFTFDFTVSDAEKVCEFFSLPVSILDPVEITGELSDIRHELHINVDAPYLIQGNNLVESTFVTVELNGAAHHGNVYATTHYPTKKGPMDMVAVINSANDRLDTNVDWELIRDNPINGNISFDTQIMKETNGQLSVDVNMHPGQINFGNEVWSILPGRIYYQDKYLKVENLLLQTETQRIWVNGSASQYPQDKLTVQLTGIELLEIFETLNIDNALICGQATGKLLVWELFTKSPQIESTSFFVKDMGYNGCVMGDGDIKITYDVEREAFCFDAVLDQADGRQSTIVGSIIPAQEYLDFNFDADHVKVGFLHPFMVAFCGGIEGYASGKAHLFGTFKDIDLTGDIMADTVRLKIDFTNTWYSASDSLHIRPGIIDLDNITIYDELGHPAKLNGWVRHEYFHKPSFDFSVTEARNFLSYNTTRADNPRWYGTIYGNGSAHVTGEPGVVNIGVAMSSAPKSTFTFELLDDEEATEYSFIVFNDVTPVIVGDAYTDVKLGSRAVEKAKSLQHLQEADEPTNYRMDIKVDINPQAQVNIVMDPIGGDKITAYGSGQMALTYDSKDEDLRLMGTYTLDKGDYNFTLQDILIKNFTIRQGSSISFTGDPYAAQLDINAIYSVNANLSDLDESFLQDKDLNRTNVPVYAVMKVTGNMLQPDIAFDLEFPTLTTDIYRKVRSIVSTDDMMNRQIIYLLALNRFYTPEYMASTTKGNELFSVASATISSQLSSMLGKLSDNWSIAPNLRSDRGDFSDIEVDLNLSSSLLNNRLLFNGNFGYRDKSLNQNQFIGDFDIEYLLNRSGNIRLKAYNRYNDQNYYLRTAQTTQGVGIVWSKDFDNLFSFMRKK